MRITFYIIAYFAFTLVLLSGCDQEDHSGHNHGAGHGKHESHSGSGNTKADPNKYSLDVCVVSNEKLGSMGDPVTIMHGEKEIKFCCKSCVKKFKADPDKYLKIIAEAEKTGKTPEGTGDHGDHDEE
jgi:hypothetical protein